MQVKSKKVDVSIERRILTAFITSEPYLKKVQKIYNKDYFTTPASRKIAKWCLTYYKKYGDAPTHEDEGMDFPWGEGGSGF